MYIKTKCITSGATDEVRCSLKIIFKQDIVLKRSLAMNLHILRTGVFNIYLWKLMILNMNGTTVLHIIWAHVLGWCNFHEWHHQQCMFDPAGRYEDDFVSERMRQLQLWVDRMVRHPVISQSEVFNHFLTCTDEKVMLHMYNVYNSPVYRVVVFDNGVVHVHVCICYNCNFFFILYYF